MTAWELEFTRPGQKAFDALPPADREAMERTLDRLTRNPSDVDLKKIRGTADLYRVRRGRWRAIVIFDQARHVITVQEIDQRKDVYR